MSIEPPGTQPTPKWASTLVNAANARNRARMSDEKFTVGDLCEIWSECGGCCAVSGMPFSFRVVGDGQARHPFAPSLDRIDRRQPYVRGNVRLVVSIANFAMNAWSLDPLIELATAAHAKHGTRHPGREHEPADLAVDSAEGVDADRYETDAGVVSFPPRQDLLPPILEFLQDRERKSREIEEMLAHRFGITDLQRRVILANGHPAGAITWPGHWQPWSCPGRLNGSVSSEQWMGGRQGCIGSAPVKATAALTGSFLGLVRDAPRGAVALRHSQSPPAPG
jgi:hypothetical protein